MCINQLDIAEFQDIVAFSEFDKGAIVVEDRLRIFFLDIDA